MVKEDVRLGIVSGELGSKLRGDLLVSGRRARSAPYRKSQYLKSRF